MLRLLIIVVGLAAFPVASGSDAGWVASRAASEPSQETNSSPRYEIIIIII